MSHCIKKLALHVFQPSRLVDCGWEADAAILRTSIFAMVHCPADYCASIWCTNVYTHLADFITNDALHIVTGCLRPTLTIFLSILAGIQPAELPCKGNTLHLARLILESNHLYSPSDAWFIRHLLIKVQLPTQTSRK